MTHSDAVFYINNMKYSPIGVIWKIRHYTSRVTNYDFEIPTFKVPISATLSSLGTGLRWEMIDTAIVIF